jgi:hypothetical protein
LVVAGALGAPACFVGYDSRWGEAKRAQQRVAAQSGPAAISAAPDEEPSPDAGKHTWSVRLRPNAQYLAQTIDAPKQIDDLLEDSNRILEPTFGLRLEKDRLQTWSRDSEDDLGAALAALRTDDPGRDVDLVVGLIGSLSRHTDSFHEVGMAAMPGKHLVVRAAARADEHDAIDRSFYELSDDERARLVRTRKRHRALAVFLHEVGHCLGALHERDARSLMNPAYNTKMSGFGAGAVALMRVTLDSDDRGEARECRRATCAPAALAAARGRLELLIGATGADWIESEREAEVGRLQAFLDSTPDAAASAPSPAAAALQVPPEIAPRDADRFVRARQALQSGAAKVSYEWGKPLFSAYPDVYAVQDLRCQLAAIRWLPREELLTECASFNRLSAALDGGADVRNP